MPRSRINENFIDKTFSIVANILLRIIPTTSGEKEAFTYYRDGAIWFFYLLLFLLRIIPTTSGEKRAFTYYRDGAIWFYFFTEIGKKWKKPTLAEGEICKYKGLIPSVVYPRLMQPHMLKL